MAKKMQRRHAVPLAVLASFAIYLSPLPVHGGVTTVGLVFWQESGQTPGPLGGFFAAVNAATRLSPSSFPIAEHRIQVVGVRFESVGGGKTGRRSIDASWLQAAVQTRI